VGGAVFKSSASPSTSLNQAKGSRRIRDHLSLSLPYGASGMPPDLAAVFAAWPSLPEAIRAGIVAMVKASRTTPPARKP
jgi:hypothetical protein